MLVEIQDYTLVGNDFAYVSYAGPQQGVLDSPVY